MRGWGAPLQPATLGEVRKKCGGFRTFRAPHETGAATQRPGATPVDQDGAL